MSTFRASIVILALLVIVAAGAWSLPGKEDRRKLARPSNEERGNSRLGEPNEFGPDGWMAYDNDRLGFSLRYPSDWYYEESSTEVMFTPLAPDDPKRSSSVGIASSLTAARVSAPQALELVGSATTKQNIKVGDTSGTLLLLPNAYAGGFSKSYLFPTSEGKDYLWIAFYDEGMGTSTYPFEAMVQTLHIEGGR